MKTGFRGRRQKPGGGRSPEASQNQNLDEGSDQTFISKRRVARSSIRTSEPQSVRSLDSSRARQYQDPEPQNRAQGSTSRMRDQSRPERKAPPLRWLSLFSAKSQKTTQNSKVVALPRPKAHYQPSPFRLLLVWGILMLMTLGLAVKLFRLQVISGPSLAQKARQQQAVYVDPYTPRRPIVDRNGDILAIDQPAYQLFVHPKYFRRLRTEIAQKLGTILNRPPEDLLKQFAQAPTGILLEYALQEDAANQIKALQLDGLDLVQRHQRIYPQQTLAADVVGYVNEDGHGQAGVEFSQHPLLSQPMQSIQLKRLDNGALIPDTLPAGFLHRDDLRLQLTLDMRLQRVARLQLAQRLKQYSAKRGTVIVMDARNGEILTMVSEPSYDPNKYYKANLELFKNWAVTDLYEPGSTFKPLNVAIALESGAIKPDDMFYSEGRIQIGGWPIEDYDYSAQGARGSLRVGEILQYSSNVGMVHIIQQMKRDDYYRWLEKMNMGQKSGIDLPSEVASQLKSRSQFLQAPIEAATAAFGQGLSLTPMQLVQLHGILANGGKLVTPHVTRGLYTTDGQAYWRSEQPEGPQIFSPQTTQTVIRMMEDVVNKGTGKGAKLPGYRIAGKTGTAQKANPYGGYYENAKITSFVAIFPADAPRYVILAVVDEPKGSDAFGSTVAAPIVKAMVEALAVIEGIPPTKTP